MARLVAAGRGDPYGLLVDRLPLTSARQAELEAWRSAVAEHLALLILLGEYP